MKIALFAAAGLATIMASAPAQAGNQNSSTVSTQVYAHGGSGGRSWGGGSWGGGSWGGNWNGGSRNWGPIRNGRWYAGWGAPGGWSGYRQPVRGFVLPTYWIQPTYYIGNYGYYGFSQPQPGYQWYRYYNDAVMANNRGQVYSYVPNVNWGGYGDVYQGQQTAVPNYAPEYRPSVGTGAVYGGDEVYAGDATYGTTYQHGGTYQGGYTGQTYGTPVYANPRRPATHGGYAVSVDGYNRCRKDNNLAGALIGGAVGAIAGNRIAGKGDRLAGSLIGGGVGALAGYAIDKATDDPCYSYMPAEYRGGYQGGGYQGGGYQGGGYQGGGYQGGGYQGGGYGYQGGGYYVQPGASTTTVIVAGGGGGSTTTTTEEIVEEYYEYESDYGYVPSVPAKGKNLRKPAYVGGASQQAAEYRGDGEDYQYHYREGYTPSAPVKGKGLRKPHYRGQ